MTAAPPARLDLSSSAGAWTAIRVTAHALAREATTARNKQQLPGALKALLAAAGALGVDLAMRTSSLTQPPTPLEPRSGKRGYGLSPREMQVLQGMANGGSNASIAECMRIGEDTVKTHARRLFRKLKARDRAHAVSIAYRSGVLSI